MITKEKLQEFLILKDETPRIEFKLKYELSGQNSGKIKDEVAKDILALTNTAGRSSTDTAHLIIGAKDQLKPDGTRDFEDVRSYNYSAEQFLKIVNARCAPGVPHLEFEELEVNGNYYGVIEIPPSPFIHELIRNLDTPKGTWLQGSVVIRRGSEIGIATLSELKLMEREKEKWSGSPAIQVQTPLQQLEEYISDPRKSIAQNKLIISETRKLHEALNTDEFLRKDADEDFNALNIRIGEYDEITNGLVELFVLGCHHGNDEQNSIWADALTIIGDITETGAVPDRLLKLRRYPALLLFYAAGVAAVAGEKYKILSALINKTQIRRWRILQTVSEALPPATVVDSYDRKHLSEYSLNQMPLEFHLQIQLRPFLKEVVHTEDRYLDCFTKFEYLYALSSMEKGRGVIQGSYMWNSEAMRKYQQSYMRSRIPIISETDAEIEKTGSNWLPFKNGVFASDDWDSFLEFKKASDEKFVKAVTDRWDY